MKEQLIISIQSLINLSEKEIDVIKLLFKERSIKKGEFFLADGHVSQHVGFILKGLMRYYINMDGETKHMRLHKRTILYAIMKVLYRKHRLQKSFRR